MNGLTSLLANYEEWLAPLKVKAPEGRALQRAVKAINAEGGGARVVADPAELQTRVQALIEAEGAIGLSSRDLREICKVFLHAPSPPGRDPAFGLALLNEVARRGKRPPLLHLINTYLDEFSTDDPDIRRLAAALSGIVSNWSWRDRDVWPAVLRRFDLFATDLIAGEIAAAVMASELSHVEILKGAGLTSESRLVGGLAQAALQAGCRTVQGKKGSAVIPLQLKLLEWSTPDGKALSMPEAWPDLAAALLLPWRGSSPPEEHRRLLVDTAIRCADPRIRPARWKPVQDAFPEAHALIIQWLTKASVEQFFDVVTETMTDRPDMWQDRRRFWTRYLDAGLIDAAWVAFGSDGALRASQAARRSGDASLALFGRIGSGGGRTPQHAALIMRIGDLTVVDWSHNGKWNIWDGTDRGHPKMFQHNSRGWADYSPSELMNAPRNGPHMSNWKWQISNEIYNLTGRRA